MNELDKSTNVAKQFAECFYAKFDANRAELAQLYVSFFVLSYLCCLCTTSGSLF